MNCCEGRTADLKPYEATRLYIFLQDKPFGMPPFCGIHGPGNLSIRLLKFEQGQKCVAGTRPTFFHPVNSHNAKLCFRLPLLEKFDRN